MLILLYQWIILTHKMSFLNNRELLLRFHSLVENDDLKSALDLFMAQSDEFRNIELAQCLCYAFDNSNTPDKWISFWKLLLQQNEKSYEFKILLGNIITESQKQLMMPFFISLLRFPELDHFIVKKAFNAIIPKIEPNLNYLIVLSQEIIASQDSNIENQYFRCLLKRCFDVNNPLPLQCIYFYKGADYFYNLLFSLQNDELLTIAKRCAETSMNHQFLLDLIKEIPFQHKDEKKDFIKKIIFSCFEKKNTNLIQRFLDNNDITNVQEIINMLNKSDRKKIITSIIIYENADISSIMGIICQLKAIELYQDLVLESFDAKNISLLKLLSKMPDTYDFKKASSSLNPEELRRLLDLDEENADFITSEMRPFIRGYGYIKYENALLTLAQRSSRKQYNFDPVLIKDKEAEIDDFFNTLAIADKPIKQTFIIAGIHFAAGEVSIDTDNHAKMFFLDSLGYQNTDELFHSDFLIHFANKFPHHDIFFSKEKRQNALQGCTVFALDDMAHLTNLRVEGHQDIWGYLESEKKEDNKVEIQSELQSKVIYVVPLPLSLTRTMQSESLLTKIIPEKSESEQKFKINKKQQTTFDSVNSFFQITTPDNPKLRNTRLDYKLEKMAYQNADYLLSHSIDEVTNAKHFFTFESFKRRLEEKQLNRIYRDVLDKSGFSNAINALLNHLDTNANPGIQLMIDKINHQANQFIFSHQNINTFTNDVKDIIKIHIHEFEQNDTCKELLIQLIQSAMIIRDFASPQMLQKNHKYLRFTLMYNELEELSYRLDSNNFPSKKN